MSDKIIISPSILAADPANLERDVRRIEKAGADYLHIDIMDGHFVPNLSYSANVVKALRDKSSLVFDVHLMLSHPERFIDEFAEGGADIITIHEEAECSLRDTLMQIKSHGIKVGVSIKPATPIDVILDDLDIIDMVLLMTVEPGFGGQKYMSFVDEKISDLKRIIDKRGLDIDIEVDGGVTIENIHEPIKAGANVIVSGSAIFNSDDFAATISLMRDRAKRGVTMREGCNI